MIIVISTLTAKPGTADQVFAAAAPCIEATRHEPGCVSYDLNESRTIPDQLVFVERWETREHLQSHFDQPHMAAWREAGAPYILNRQIEIIHADKIETL